MKEHRSSSPTSSPIRAAAHADQAWAAPYAVHAGDSSLEREVGESAPLTRQRDLTRRVQNSPLMATQKKQIEVLAVQRAEEDEMLQGRFAPAQRAAEEEEPLQGRFESIQRAGEEEELQGKLKPRHAKAAESVASAPGRTGLPESVQVGISQLAGMSLDTVRVHRNSARPAQINALAYTQGSEIHVGPGQERHLAHEAWHVVQQAQGRVRSTMTASGVPINDDASLEREADVMGARAADVGERSIQQAMRREQ